MNLRITEIGSNAGRVWNELEKRTFEFSIQELCQKLTMTFEEAVLAIGWREKIILL